MRFQKKLVIMYTLFTLAMACLLGIGYYKYSISNYEKKEERNLEIAASQLVVQVEEMIKPMELTMNYILSNEEILTGIRVLADYEKELYKRYSREARENIRKGITTDYINNNFYRVIVFNRTGNIISTYDAAEKKVKQTADFEQMPWLSVVDKEKGKPVIISDHKDTWGTSTNPRVFSLLKAVQGNNMGYIEVQKKVDELQEQLQVPKENMEFCIWVNGNDLLYSSTEIENAFSDDKIHKKGEFIQKCKREDTGEEILVAKNQSDIYDIQVIAFEETQILKKESSYIVMMTLVIASVFFLVSVIFVNLISHYLTKPLRQLREVMENTRLENLGSKIEVDSTNDEIEALSNSYKNVLDCLQKAIVKERRISMLHLQAQFDLLQSQVNPHFLFNVLNIISARGMQNGDEKICEICECMAVMLRYSTNTKTRYTVVKDELEYLKKYFYLLKIRFEHKITFKIQVDSRVAEQIIPKVSLQQIVENCVNHGFENCTLQMRVEIIGVCEADRWYIKIRDNGQGFSGEVLIQLEDRMKQAKKKIFEEPDAIELEIGGLGIVNIYARLLLLYNENAFFKMENTEDGAQVVIGAMLDRRKDDKGIDCG